MVIGTDYRAKQREERKRTPRFSRFPLGEKGLGRLSVHKLGRSILLVTRQEGGEELLMDFDLERLEASKDLDSALVRLDRRVPEAFPGDSHGTRIEITSLRESWSRGAIRKLHRAVNSLCSPFDAPGEFSVTMRVPGHQEWIESLFTADQARDSALYQVHGRAKGGRVELEYRFCPPAGIRVEERTSRLDFRLSTMDGRKPAPVDLGGHDIGPIGFTFLLFDRDPAVMRAVTDDVKGLKDFLNENGGVRIYRDGIRVYDFGEPGNDWLNLDLRRVNTPVTRTSNNQVLGSELDATQSTDLREKTNREGFIENDAFSDFRLAITSILTQIEAEKAKDQRRLREVMGKGTGGRVFLQLTELRDALQQRALLTEMEPQLRRVEKEMEAYRDQLLHAAVPGLTIGMMLHGAEKVLAELLEAVRSEAKPDHVKQLVEALYRAMRPVTGLLKNPGTTVVSARALCDEAIFSTQLRLKRHGIQLVEGPEESFAFKVKGSRQMLIASITNLIDNSIHWLEVRQPEEKALFVGIQRGSNGQPLIVVADNGAGFGDDDPEDLVTPFFSRRSGGMGLGLYIVDEVMRAHQGDLVFPRPDDLELPSEFDGAVVALRLPEAK